MLYILLHDWAVPDELNGASHTFTHSGPTYVCSLVTGVDCRRWL